VNKTDKKKVDRLWVADRDRLRSGPRALLKSCLRDSRLLISLSYHPTDFASTLLEFIVSSRRE